MGMDRVGSEAGPDVPAAEEADSVAATVPAPRIPMRRPRATFALLIARTGQAVSPVAKAIVEICSRSSSPGQQARG